LHGKAEDFHFELPSSAAFGYKPMCVDEVDYSGRCGSCGAYKRMGTRPDLGPIGMCALEQLSFPVTAKSTCSQYRPKGQEAPAPKKRSTSRRASPAISVLKTPPVVNLPSEIDLDMDIDTFRDVLRQVLQEELGLGEAELGNKWEGGEIILKPGREGVAEKRIPLDVFFKKIVTLRDKLRVLEQRINSNSSLSPEDKVALQQYVTNCYGTLTTFNVLFAKPKEDGFKGATAKPGSKEESSSSDDSAEEDS
jgi:hypothetical protein